jgi:8-amino-7-oxononanoate synthase
MNDYTVNLYENKNSRDGSIMGKIIDFQSHIRTHELLKLNLYRKSPLVSACDREVKIHERHSGEEVKMLMFGSNNYLGAVTCDNAVKIAAGVINEFGIGSGGVPLLSGTTVFQSELEKKISGTKGFDDAIIFSSGFTANLGAIIGLLRPNNLIVHDKLNHASLLDATVMSGAKMLRYKHNDPVSLENILKENYLSYPDGILVATDGVFSMDGDIAKLPEILEVVQKYKALLLIDDAHATGVIGHKGEGSLSHFNIKEKENIIVTGTLSKAVGTVGGFITASQPVIDYLRIYARSNMYSTSLPPSVCASAIEVFNYMKNSSAVEQLSRNSYYLRQQLRERGFNILNSETAIIPVIVGDEKKLTHMSYDLAEKGIIVNYVFPPVVHPKMSRLRISSMATHTKDDMDCLIKMLEEVDEKYKIRQ